MQTVRLRHPPLKAKRTDQRIEESLVNLLLPITRVLVRGGAGIDELVRAVKRAYLLGAMQAVSRPDGRVNVSRLSVATGMTRKEVSALLGGERSSRGAAKRGRGQQRALRVFRGWLTDPRFRNRSGRPSELNYRGKKQSFTLLVKLYGGDVTPKSVLRELERMEAVHVTGQGLVRLRTSRNRNNVEANYQLSELARLFEDFSSAVLQSHLGPNAPSFFGFKDSKIPSARDAAYFMRRLSRRAVALLDDFQQWSNNRESAENESQKECDGVRVGLGVYLMSSKGKSARSTGEASPVEAGTHRRKRAN